jgi:23S rRNA pseudouridine1911/1915/1917 synthase
LVGDVVYGGKPVQGLAGQALHAFRLGLAHPITAQRLRFEALPPPAFQRLLASEGLRYNESKSPD